MASIIRGLTPEGKSVPFTVDDRGELPEPSTLVILMSQLLLEQRAVRLGLERLNRMKFGELLELAQSEV